MNKQAAVTTILTLTELQLRQMTCWSCGVVYAMPEKLCRTRKQDGGNFYCPNGHAAVFRTTEVEELRRELEAERKRHENTEALRAWAEKEAGWAREARDQAKRSLSATRGTLTRLKKRVQAGVCPCCRRTFQNLAAHMAGQHPGFAGEDVEPGLEARPALEAGQP